jgi:hypothetical protein
MQPDNHLEAIRKMGAGMPACDYLAGLRRFREYAALLTEDERPAFNRALAGMLSRRENCTVLLVNLAADLDVREAGPVLLAHALSSGYWPTPGSQPPVWTDLERAAIARALSALGVCAALPILEQHLAEYRRSARRPGWLARITGRGPRQTGGGEGVPEMTEREAAAIGDAIAKLR